MKRCLLAFASCATAAAFVVGPLAGIGYAHGTRGVADHKFIVGWAVEPAFVGFPNAVQLIVQEPDGTPVEGVEKELRVEVSIGGEKTEPMELRTVFDSPGEYRADLMPTVPGGYTFRFFGDFEGAQVDESFESPKDGFNEVEGTSEIAFPKAAPSTTELAERLRGVENTANDAEDAIALPRTLAIVGIVVGAIALIVGARPRRRA
jgi:hypothetical protein